MLRKEITYTGVDEVTRTEPFYFNFNKLELMETELELGGIEETIQRLQETSDIKGAYYIFKDLLLSAYGKKAADGKGFDKEDPETGRPYRKELLASPALSELIIELMSDAPNAAMFFRQMMPKDMQDQAAANDAALAANPQMAPGATPESVEAESKEPNPDELPRDALLGMSQEEFDKVAGTDTQKMSKRTLTIAMQRLQQKK